jgi:hypothetical protein
MSHAKIFNAPFDLRPGKLCFLVSNCLLLLLFRLAGPGVDQIALRVAAIGTVKRDQAAPNKKTPAREPGG